MKTTFNIFLLTLTILVFGCGREQVVSNYEFAKLPVRAVVNKTCSLKFSQSGLCADINWIQGPSADQASAFEVTFSKLDKPNSEPIEPSAQVGAFIRMTCCGSVFFPTVTKLTNGKYLVSNVKFTPGKWEVYVQLKNGNSIEKQFTTVNLDE